MRSGFVWGVAGAGLALTLAGNAVSAAGKTATFKVTAVQSTPQGQVTMTSNVWVTATQARADGIAGVDCARYE
jgi:hypothetical protein